jgi:hypothetical protein
MTSFRGRVNITETIVGSGTKGTLLENELLSVTLLVGHGADIHSVVYKPRGLDVMWKPPRVAREAGIGPHPTGDSQTLWSSYYMGGWQVVFPNCGSAVEYRGVLLDFHGEAARTAWTLEGTEIKDGEASVSAGIALQKSPFHIHRKVTIRSGEPMFSITETITNECPDAIDCMWLHHPAFGPPLVSPECVVQSGARVMESDDSYDVPGNDLPLGNRWEWPRARNKRGEEVDLSRIPPPGSGYSRILYLQDFAKSWYALTNHALKLGAGMVWDGNVLPYATFWQETGGVRGYPFYGNAYELAIEPSSSYPGQGLTRVMETTKNHLTLAPGEKRTVNLRFVFIEPHPRKRIDYIDSSGGVHQA